ncbi:ENV1 protein, partial [Agelaius phoeniceus]|nr:ENV1 protein [Agelaius phoeniceus]
VRLCLQDWIIGRPRNSNAPLLGKRERPSRNPTSPEKLAPSKLKQQRYLCVILFLGLVGGGQADTKHYPHQPFRWVLRHLSGEGVIKEIVTADTPSFEFRLKDIFPMHTGHPRFQETTVFGMYWCPASNPGKSYCNYPGHGYCGHWGCETIVISNRWTPQQPDKFLQIKYTPHGCIEPKYDGDGYALMPGGLKQHTCTGYIMTILQPTHDAWATGKVWTAYAHLPNRGIWANIQIIRLPASGSQSAGPNPVLAVSRPREEIAAGSSSHETQRSKLVSPSDLLTKPTLSSPFLSVLNATFLSLNQSNPNLTESCWLCYDAQPPFYEGVAFDLPFIFSKSNNPHQCRWDAPRRGITLSQVTG